MIRLKKMVVATALCAFTAAFSFAQEVSFENKLSSGIVNINITDDNTDTAFAGFENETTAEYSSEQVDMGVTLKFNIAIEDDDAVSIGAEDFADDYFIEFRPVEVLGIGFHKGYAVAGSYLPCLDGEIEAANIGSDFGLFVRPVEGLVIASGIDFITYFGRDGKKPLINAGAEYAVGETITFGAAFRNIASDDRSFGAFASFTGVEGLTLNAGFSYNGEIEDYNISGNLLNAAVMFNKDALGIYVDAAFAVGGDEDEANELYAAANVSYQITEAFSASLFGSFTTDFDNDDTWAIGINPSVGYMINEHNYAGAGVFINIMKAAKAVSIPVYWKYTF